MSHGPIRAVRPVALQFQIYPAAYRRHVDYSSAKNPDELSPAIYC